MCKVVLKFYTTRWCWSQKDVSGHECPLFTDHGTEITTYWCRTFFDVLRHKQDSFKYLSYTKCSILYYIMVQLIIYTSIPKYL